MSTETVSRCIICSSDSISKFLECRDYFVTQEVFTISVCNECAFCFTSPRPTPEDVGRYYESEEYVSHSKTSAGMINRLFHIARKYTIRSKKRIVRKYAAGNNLLDYGCGTGEFIGSAAKDGWNAIGIEPNPLARDHAIKTFGVEVLDEKDLGKIEDASQDAISLWHVLEHIYPAGERLSEFHRKLKDDGILFVALPNMDSYDARKYGPHWAAYDVPRHIYHFTPKSIQALMAKHGFSHIATRPMALDAFYISMLSEKYKTGSPKNIRAGFTGIISNLSACLGKKNYSSLIYIFKKSK